MRVLLVIDNMGAGGAQRQMSNLAVGLAKRGITVDLFTYHDANFFESTLRKHHINLINCKKTNKFGLNVFTKLYKLVKRNKYDFAISYLNTPNFYLSMVKLFSFTKTIVITSERFKTDFSTRNRLLLQMRISHAIANLVICNSKHECTNWQTNSSLSAKKFITIYNGVDSSEFFPAKTYSAVKHKIIVIGSVAYYKNGKCVIEALNLLKQKFGFEVELTWMGQRVTHITAYANCLREMNKMLYNYNLISNWVWKDPVKDVNAVLEEYDCLLLASTDEGLPNVVCEALMAGKPVIVSNVLDHALLVKEPERGYVFNPEVPAELADKIKLFYENTAESLQLMSKNAHDYAREQLDNEVFVTNYFNLLTRLKES